MDRINIRDRDTSSDMQGGGIVPSGGAIEAGDQGIGNEEGLVQYGKCGNVTTYQTPRGAPRRYVASSNQQPWSSREDIFPVGGIEGSR